MSTYQATSARFSGSFLVVVPSANVKRGDQATYERKSDHKTIEGTLTPICPDPANAKGATLCLFTTTKADRGLEGLTKAELVAKLQAAGIQA